MKLILLKEEKMFLLSSKTFSRFAMIIFILGSLIIVNAQIGPNHLPELRSDHFSNKYEAIDSPPTEEASETWISGIRTPEVNEISNGILDVTFESLRMWRLQSELLKNIQNSTGWTFEVKLIVLEQYGTEGALCLTVDDQEGEAGGVNGIQIHEDKTQWSKNGPIAYQNSNSSSFKTFRIAEEANSDSVHLWIDGDYIGSHKEENQAGSTYLNKHLLIGSYFGTYEGRVALDYIRWDSTGAFQPSEELVNFQAPAEDNFISEEGETSVTYSATLNQQPQEDVEMRIFSCFGDTSGVAIQNSVNNEINLTFTPDNWNSPQEITITALDDTTKEWNHQITLRHSLQSQDSTFNGKSTIQSFQIIDNDEVLRISDNIRDLSALERFETSDSFEIYCGLTPKSEVYINFDYDNTQFTVTPDPLIITKDNYTEKHQITLTAKNDTLMDRLIHFPLNIVTSSEDGNFDSIQLPTVRINIENDDRSHTKPNDFSVPIVNLDQSHRQSIVDRRSGQYLGHPTTVMLPDSETIQTVYPTGHGRGAIQYRESINGGLTWNGLRPTPDNWSTSREVPTIFKMTDSLGQERLVLFSGLYPTRRAYSEDYGETWSPLEKVGNWGGIVVMGCAIRLKDGRYITMFHDDGRFFTENGSVSDTFKVYKSYSDDGGLTWSYPEVVIECDWAQPCEPGIFRSPDGDQLLVLLRENSRQYNSFFITSNDEGDTWSAMKELPASLTGDRHTGTYLPDDRMFVSFRDMAHETPTKGDWVGWIGTYDDIINGKEGQYRLNIKDNQNSWDCGYPGVELLPDSTIVTTTYGHWDGSGNPYVVTSRFKPEEIDYLANHDNTNPLSPGEYDIIIFGSQMDTLAGEVENYPEILNEELPKAGITPNIINKTKINETTTEALGRLQSDVIDENPDLVFLQFGKVDASVDLSQNLEPKTSRDNFNSNLRKMISQLQNNGIRVILMTPNLMCWNNSDGVGTRELYHRDIEGSPYDTTTALGVNNILYDYVDIIRNIAIDTHLDYVNVFIELYNYCKYNEIPFNDVLYQGLEPNELGHRIIADNIYKQLQIKIPDDELPQKSSLDFKYKYEAESSALHIEQSDYWKIPWQTPTNINVDDGILTGEFIGGANVDQMWLLQGQPLDSLSHEKGWTIEVRLKVLRQDKTRGAIAINIDDRNGSTGGIGGIQIHKDKTQWSIDRETADDNPNNDNFHTFRLAQTPYSDDTKCWRDGKYLGKNNESFTFSQSILDKFLLVGSWSNRLGGKVSIDYIRWDLNGAFAPPPQTSIKGDNKAQIPGECKLYDNFPNPFNSATQIQFVLAERSPIKLQVLNIKGQLVKTLLNNALQPGHYSQTWQGNNNNDNLVSSGIYFYKLQTEQSTKIGKMVMIK